MKIFNASWSLRYGLMWFAMVPVLGLTITLVAIYISNLNKLVLQTPTAVSTFAISKLTEKIQETYPAYDATVAFSEEIGNPDIIGLSFYNAKSKLMQDSGNAMAPLDPNIPINLKNGVYVAETDNTLRIKKFISKADAPPEEVSWLELEYSVADERKDLQQQLISYVSVAFFGVAVVVIFTWFCSGIITRQLYKFSDSITKLQKGDFQVDLKNSGSLEGRLITTQVSQLALTLEYENAKKQASIARATADLAEALQKMECQNAELKQARTEALKASEVKSVFLTNISHELRTPLNGIIGFLELLRKTHLSEQQRNFVNTIETSSKGLLTIVNDLLDLSKLEAGKLALDSSSFHLRYLVDDVLGLFGPEAQRKGLEIAALIYPETPDLLVGDPMRLRQVLTNLIGNAIKFTPQGHIYLNITVENARPDSWLLKFSVADSGIGLTDQQLRKLFKAFSQADASTAREYGGTGLGLAISKYLVQQMEGAIHAESAPNEGSVFSFTARMFRNQASADVDADLAFSDLNVAVCEGLAFTRRSIVHRLRFWDVNVRDFSSLYELSISGRKFDVIIYGLKTLEPSLSEQEIIRGLRTNKVVVIALTIIDDLQRLQALETLGIFYTLPRPIHFEHLADILRDHHQPFKALPKAHLTQSHYVLAVDDNLANLRLVELLLKQHDFNVITAQSGVEALDLLKKYPIQLILMDIQMPGMDGKETSVRIRKDAQWEDISIVALTAHASESEFEQLLKVGVDDFLVKPIDESKLMAMIDKWSNQKRVRPEKPSEAEEERLTSIIDPKLCLHRANNDRALALSQLKSVYNELIAYLPLARSEKALSQAEALLSATHRLHGLLKYSGTPSLEDCIDFLEVNLKNLAPKRRLAELLQDVITEGERVIERYEQSPELPYLEDEDDENLYS